MKSFAESDDAGLLPACWDCGDVARKLRPGVPLPILIQSYKDADGSTDPDFHVEMDQALLIADGKAKASFGSGGEVSTSQAYGMRMEQTYALFTTEEFGPVLGQLPPEMKKSKKTQAVPIPFGKPEQASLFWMVDLNGLPAEVLNWCKKVIIYYDTSANMQEIFLAAADNLAKDQAKRLFPIIAAGHMDGRPSQFRPGAERPLTLEEWKNKVRPAVIEMEPAADAQASDGDEDSDDAPLQPPARPGQKRALGFALPSSGRPKAAAKAKSLAAKAKAKAAASVPAVPAAPAAESVSFVPPPTGQASRASRGSNGDGEARSESTVGNAGKKILRLDSDMAWLRKNISHLRRMRRSSRWKPWMGSSFFVKAPPSHW